MTLKNIKKIFLVIITFSFLHLTVIPSKCQFISVKPDSSLDSLRNSLLELQWAEREVKDILDFLPGKIYLHSDANERNFKKKAQEANILHLATHALIDDQNPLFSKLVFTLPHDSTEDGFLNVGDTEIQLNNKAPAFKEACVIKSINM